MAPADLDAVVGLHERLIEDSAFSRFGPGVLKAVYRGGLASPSGAGWVCPGPGGGIVGFVFGARDTRRLFRDILAGQWPALAWGAAAGLLRRPGLLRRLQEIPSYFGKAGESAGAAELLFIAVEPRQRGEGIAQALVGAALDAFSAEGIARVAVTVSEGNVAPGRLLEGFGFRRARSFEFLGRKRALFLAELP
ncbi:MAG: GNAT family N-acetyltransferase [Elusimicrobia bacterium]|jgi:ribosomal protein S18 acetylase RimI-like enzyme|nr:GNAT family N-acetyltransferase [Elusimicrobiota bacterium]